MKILPFVTKSHLVSQRIWTPDPNPLQDMDPPSQVWTPLPNFPFKHPLYHIW